MTAEGRTVPAGLDEPGLEAMRSARFFALTGSTGRVLAHSDVGSMTRQTPALGWLVAQVFVAVCPYAIVDGEPVLVRSRRSSVGATARLTDQNAPGTTFTWFHLEEANFPTQRPLDSTAKVPGYEVCLVAVEPVPQEVGA